MIDLQTLKERTDLLALVERDATLKRVSTTAGGEWAGPCPFCGGRDRFRVQPNSPGGGRWLCRHCTDGKWQSVIDYVMRRDGVDFKQALATLNGGLSGAALPRSGRKRAPSPRREVPAYDAPAGDWQACALQVIDDCERRLWDPEGAKALDYLRKRGLQDRTIKHFRLGYSPGAEIAGLWVPRGVVIPCVVGGEVWYLKIRLPAAPGEQKFICVKGSRTAAIFNADSLLVADHALFVEGEFDCMIAWQALGEVLPVCTMGSATNKPDLATWGVHLMVLQTILAAYDGDPAGEKGLADLVLMSERVKLAPLPEGDWKDVNDFYLAGGDLWGGWILPYLAAYTEPVMITTFEALQAATREAESIRACLIAAIQGAENATADIYQAAPVEV